MRVTIINGICGGAMGFLFASMGFGVTDYQFWAGMFILVCGMANSMVD